MIKKILFFIFILTQFLFSQEKDFNEQLFFQDMKNSYYSLSSTDVNNFTVLLQNIRTEKFAMENWKNNEIFPLQLIWLSSDRLFLSEQGVPALSDSAKKVYTGYLNDLKKQITGVLFDLKRFYLNGIYKSISSDYKINKIKDVVEIQFSTVFQSDTTLYRYYFGQNGLCLKIETVTPSNNSLVETYPHFKIIKTRWLITGWEVQMSTNGEIQTGFIITLNNKLLNDIWVPSEMIINVQQAKNKGTTFSDVVKFRNFLFNQPLQYIEQPK